MQKVENYQWVVDRGDLLTYGAARGATKTKNGMKKEEAENLEAQLRSQGISTHMYNAMHLGSDNRVEYTITISGHGNTYQELTDKHKKLFFRTYDYKKMDIRNTDGTRYDPPSDWIRSNGNDGKMQ